MLLTVAQALDGLVAGLLPLLAGVILVFAADDLLVDLLFLRLMARRKQAPPPIDETLPEQLIAIFVPCWQEDAVIEAMVRHNAATIRYTNYRWFLGVYPNDPQTRNAAQRLAAEMPNVTVSIAPHPGPTSKADCLNWAYQELLLHEEDNQQTFNKILIHDAEDVIHPLELCWINTNMGTAGMVQTPVLALQTPLTAWTHGLYCDDFAEWQTRDMEVRSAMGSFVPSAGVGTAYSREALAALANDRTGCIFEPVALTEDYENGLRLHELGFDQKFLPLSQIQGDWLATREYFPKGVMTAIRQRSRWATGNMLQAWDRHGWRGSWSVKYWLWRDRKGLLGHPAAALANLCSAYGLATFAWASLSGAPWAFGHRLQTQASWAVASLLVLGYRTIFRMWTTGRIYGWKLALGVPVRLLLGNYINLQATTRALWRFSRSKALGEPLRWVKTSHQYPSRAALATRRTPLGEVLLRLGLITQDQLAEALRRKPPELRLGEWLRELGWLSEEGLYQGLALQQGLGLATRVHATPRVARSLPLAVVLRWRVVPLEVLEDTLQVASPEPPSEEMVEDLQSHTRLKLQFRLIPPSQFELRVKELKGRSIGA